jgi:hypothetical protein
MSSNRKSPDFSRIALAMGVHPLDAANQVMEAARAGKQPPRWMRRAAKALTRRSHSS